MADHHHHLQGGGGGGGGNSSVVRDYRKGNWTIQETMILVEAKKMDDERRMKRASSSSIGIGVGGESSSGNVGNNKPTELRWKWVEDYCWRKGCSRSQNQCNDKWDNLMRDYKKVRDYERKITNQHHHLSYWKIEKSERKEKNLPSNLLHQIYDALVEVVERRGSSSSSSAQAQAQVLTMAAVPVPAAATGGYGNDINNNAVQLQIHPQLHPPLLQQPHIFSVSAVSTPLALPLPPLMAATPISTAQPPPPPPPPALPTTMCDSSDSDTSEYTYSPAKRRRKRRSTTTKTTGGGGEGTSSGHGHGHGHQHEEVGSAISKSASIIAEAIQASEEREERRHKDLLNLHERRLKIEESKTEVNRQGINGLVDAINKLANSILALASNNNNNNQSPPK